MPNKRIWILLADGGNARLIERIGRFGKLHQLKKLTHEHPLTHEHGPDRPGRVFESSSPTSHAYVPRSDWHERQKEVFAKELSTLITTAYRDNQFDEIYLVAPPAMTGYITKFIDQKHPINFNISKTYLKDLMGFSLDELEKYLDAE